MPTSTPDWRTPVVVLVAAALILTLAMGIRHGFGLFLQPISSDMGWGRETFAFALAVQNLVVGRDAAVRGDGGGPFGTARVVLGGCALYVARSRPDGQLPSTPWLFVLTAGVLIGTGLSGVTYSVVSGVLGRRFPPEKRSMALGISAAAGSFGQFAVLPFTQWLLTNIGWHGALLALAAVALLIVPLAAAHGGAAEVARARFQAVGARSDERSARPSRLRAADAGLFRLRVPGRLRRRPLAGLPGRSRHGRRTSP